MMETSKRKQNVPIKTTSKNRWFSHRTRQVTATLAHIPRPRKTSCNIISQTSGLFSDEPLTMLVFRRLIPYALMASLGVQAEAGEDSPPGLPPLPDRTNRTSNNVRDAVVHANATGSWPFRGIDITKPMDHPPDDEVGQGNGWSINIAVATNTTSNTGSSSQPRGNPQYIYINAPEDAFENPDSASTSPEDWTTCAVVWLGNRWSVEEIEQLHQDPDGSCNEVISEECISGLREKLLGRGCWLWSGELPEGCPGAVSDVMVMTSKLHSSNDWQRGSCC